MRQLVTIMMTGLMLLLAACAPAAPGATEAVSTDASATAESIIPPANDAPAQAAVPAWYTLPLVNARTGETFTFADFSGKTVLARAMALWCTNCRRGQMRWRDEVMPQVNMENTVFVSLTIETNLTPADALAYADENGFNWIFAVASPEMLQALNQQFGNGVNVPPSEPQWLIRPDGSLVGLISDNSTATLTGLINGVAS
jgi:hypothetical protein